MLFWIKNPIAYACIVAFMTIYRFMTIEIWKRRSKVFSPRRSSHVKLLTLCLEFLSYVVANQYHALHVNLNSGNLY